MSSRILALPLVFQLQQRLFNNYGNVRAEFSDYLERGPLRILDVGCSTGACGQAVFDLERDAYTGIDITDRYVQYARRTYPRGNFITMDARFMTFENASFDLISFIGVLHHMDDETATRSLGEARRVLKKGGALLVAEPVFTPNDLRSNVFLSLDRGKFIRESAQYEKLLANFAIERSRHFRLSFHRFFSVAAR